MVVFIVMNDEAQRSFLRAFALALLAGLGAFPTALLMIGAVLLGRQLDQILGTSPLFLLVLLFIAVPVSILIMIALARAAARAARGRADTPPVSPPKYEEDDT